MKYKKQEKEIINKFRKECDVLCDISYEEDVVNAFGLFCEQTGVKFTPKNLDKHLAFVHVWGEEPGVGIHYLNRKKLKLIDIDISEHVDICFKK